MKLGKHCNRLPREVAEPASSEVYKNQLDRALSNLLDVL